MRAAIRALVVEDEVEMATVIGSYREREGFEVHLSLAQDVSAVSRAEEGQLDSRQVPTHPRVLLESAAAAAQDAYDAAQVRLTVDAASPLQDIHVDPERMGQVLANLLENACGTPRPVAPSTSRPPATTTGWSATSPTPARGSNQSTPHVFERFYQAPAGTGAVGEPA